MFPGIDGFHWTFGHILFLALFFAVAVTIAATVARAAWRTSRDFRTHRAADLCWHAEFSEMPMAERRCRHELAGRLISRTCDNAFDCRNCEKYSQLAVLPATGNVGASGLNYLDDVYYHRGHTWVKPAEDGTVVIGLDDFAQHLVGTPDTVKLPKIGEQLDLNQSAWRMGKNGTPIEVRAPLEGTVIAIGSPNAGWYLKLRPRLDIRDPRALRHLLRGPEVRGWIGRELERLQMQLHAPGSAAALADGGVLLPDLMNTMRGADWETVLADTFLEA
jgi:glycine cleavage system H lipoate-binding protein